MKKLAVIRLKLLLLIKDGTIFLDDALARYIHKLQSSMEGKSKTQEELDEIAKGVNEFLEHPSELSETISEHNNKYKEIVRSYFILKQISAMYEAESKILPIQVFNEMRNALDHFIRSLIHPEDVEREAENIEQMRRHIQRAFLDISKLLCAFYDSSTKDRHLKFSDEAIGIVQEGEYQKEYTRLQVIAHEKFTEAKIQDYKLGTDGTQLVRNAYIDAVIAHKKILQYQADNYHFLKWAAAKATFLKGLKWSSAIAAGLVAGVILQAASDIL